MQLTSFQKFWSRWFPIKIRKTASAYNPFLELYFYKGQWQLTTKDAIYSDGTRYRPLLLAFEKINDQLPQISSVLVLGAGLGSAVSILQKKGFNPSFTLVERDKAILKWCHEIFKDHLNLHWLEEDASRFVKHRSNRYDMVIVDIFNSQLVPEFVTQLDFLEACRTLLNTNGFFIFNYIVKNEEQWKQTIARLQSLYPNIQVQQLGFNRIVVATKAPE